MFLALDANLALMPGEPGLFDRSEGRVDFFVCTLDQAGPFVRGQHKPIDFVAVQPEVGGYNQVCRTVSGFVEASKAVGTVGQARIGVGTVVGA